MRVGEGPVPRLVVRLVVWVISCCGVARRSASCLSLSFMVPTAWCRLSRYLFRIMVVPLRDGWEGRSGYIVSAWPRNWSFGQLWMAHGIGTGRCFKVSGLACAQLTLGYGQGGSVPALW